MSSRVEESHDHKVTITLTRGDSMAIEVAIFRDDKQEEKYIPQEGDEITFAVKRNKLLPDRSDLVDETPLIHKIIPNDTLLLTIDPQDTKELAFDTYTFDIEIKYQDGRVDTFIPEGVFDIRKEVH